VNGLVVSATVRMVDWVHRHTADGGVELAAGLGPVMGGAGLD
jgi:hypothetical protein